MVTARPVIGLTGGVASGKSSVARAFEARAAESAASGLSQYNPDGGVTSYGAGGAITWNATDKITMSAFTEYKRLAGPAADSSLVRQKGSENQLLFGVSASYKFGVSFN